MYTRTSALRSITRGTPFRAAHGALLALGLLVAACDNGAPTSPLPPGGEHTPPAVTATAPDFAATGVIRNASVTARFSVVMDTATINATTFTLVHGGTAIPAVVTYIGKVATLNPLSALAPSTQYTATVTTGAQDKSGAGLTSAVTWNFTTVPSSASGPSAVNLGTSGNYVILAKSAVSTTGVTAIVGDVAVSPAAASFLTGFALTTPTTFSTSALVTGHLFAANYAVPTPANLTTAVLDMQTAYTNAAGRTLPDFVNLGAGNVQGLNLVPGLYKWGTGVSIPSAVTLTGSSTDVWIFQVAGNLNVGNGAIVTLAGGAQASNIFWQVTGAATIGTTAQMKGNILSKTLISMNTGSTIVGRMLAQTAVTLNAATVTHP